MGTVGPLRVALVGVDGSGKTSVACRLRERASSDSRLVVLHASRPHETPDGPFHALSEHLRALSHVADKLDSAELKVAAHYLRLSTYHAAEQFFVRTYRPELVVSDRHPLVDALVYLPLFSPAGALHTRPPIPANAVRSYLGVASYDAVIHWAELVGAGNDLWRLGAQMLRQSGYPPDRLLRKYAQWLRLSLPDQVVLLELPAPEALDRLRRRGRSHDLQETPAQLSAICRSYDRVLTWLAAGSAPPTVHRLASGGGRSLDAVVDAVADLLPGRCGRESATTPPVGSRPGR